MPYPDNRAPSSGTPYGGGGEHWGGGRDRFSEHRKERYDNYNNRPPPPSYHRERDHRDRDRDRRIDKRR